MSEDAAAMIGIEVAERQRLVDLQGRAADRGYVLRAVHSGFILAHEGRLLHRMSIEDIVGILNTIDRQQ